MNNYHKIDGKISRQRCLDPDTVLKKIMDSDPVCPDPVNIRLDSKPRGDCIQHLLAYVCEGVT